MTATLRKRSGRPRSWTLEEEHRRVLDAGHSVFAERGFDGATIEAISRLALVQRPVIYARFGTKDRLFEACVDDAGEVVLGALVEGFSGVPDAVWQVRVRQCYTVLFDVSATHGDALRVLFHAGKQISADAPSTRVRQRVLSKISEFVAGLLRPGGVENAAASEILAIMLYGMSWMVAEQQITRQWKRDALIDILTDFTCGGIARLWKRELEPLKALDDRK